MRVILNYDLLRFSPSFSIFQKIDEIFISPVVSVGKFLCWREKQRQQQQSENFLFHYVCSNNDGLLVPLFRQIQRPNLRRRQSSSFSQTETGFDRVQVFRQGLRPNLRRRQKIKFQFSSVRVTVRENVSSSRRHNVKVAVRDNVNVISQSETVRTCAEGNTLFIVKHTGSSSSSEFKMLQVDSNPCQYSSMG